LSQGTIHSPVFIALQKKRHVYRKKDFSNHTHSFHGSEKAIFNLNYLLKLYSKPILNYKGDKFCVREKSNGVYHPYLTLLRTGERVSFAKRSFFC